MRAFEQQLREDLDVFNSEDLFVFLSIAERFRPHLYMVMFGNPVFDKEIADILRYFLF